MVKKSVLDIDEETWREVQKYKIDRKLKVINEAVVSLVKKGLEAVKKEKKNDR